ncbi:MAG: 16S rRNA (cytosine(1402)-N(4))-methyltransferase RsmH [Patescibacteria group bacterium]
MHQPVLLQSVIAGLDLRPGLTVVDGTINGGGHSIEIAKQIIGGHLIGIDQDATAIEVVRARLIQVPCQVTLRIDNFRRLDQVLSSLGLTQIDRLFLDLGFSSNQILSSGRGFSFQTDEPLLMTYEAKPSPGRLAARDIVNRWTEEELATDFKNYADESFARQIAQAIVKTRRTTPINTTGQLVEIIRQAVPHSYRAPGRRRHFATKVFQALRLIVNDELPALAEGLAKGFASLAIGGRLAIITFHSGEARIVKNFFRHAKDNGGGQIITRHAIKPTFEEIKINPRARSATLRIIQKK